MSGLHITVQIFLVWFAVLITKCCFVLSYSCCLVTTLFNLRTKYYVTIILVQLNTVILCESFTFE